MISPTITKALGEPAEKIVETNKEEIASREKKISELKKMRETAAEAQKENTDLNITKK